MFKNEVQFQEKPVFNKNGGDCVILSLMFM
jgi:hypothetical protein